MKITQKQLQRIILEETMRVLAEMHLPAGTDARNFQARPDTPIEEMTDEELQYQFKDVCGGEVLPRYCADVHAQIESREPDIMDDDYSEEEHLA